MHQDEKLTPRAPIVVVLGHVDHGKTTLLDKIRQTNLQSREAGGITQSIGASQVITAEGKKITFIDTPGHAAFNNLRVRGANVADIAVLVVAADDGVKPQTVEALEDIKSAKVPFIVALSKADLPSADPKKAIMQLENLGVVFDKKGGDVPTVEVSGKTGAGIDELLETIILVAEVRGISANPEGALEAVVIEATKGAGGPLASVIIRSGKLEIGDQIAAGSVSGKVKNLTDSQGQSVKSAGPADAVRVLGFSALPAVGTELSATGTAAEPAAKSPSAQAEVQSGQLPLIVKADTTGSLEAILAALPKKVVVVDSGVGEVGESNVLTAKSAGAEIFTFNLKTRSNILKFADTEDVKIESFNIIYKLLDRMDEIIKGETIETTGKAQIIAVFPFNNQKVAGCKIVEGVINKTDKLTLSRDLKDLGTVKVLSLKKQKQDITQAKVGEECGIIFEPQLDFAVGDLLSSVKK